MEHTPATTETLGHLGARAECPRPRSFAWLFWSVALLGLVVDQGSKYGIFFLRAHHWERENVVVLDGSIKFHLVALLYDEPDPRTGPLAFLRTLSTDRLHYVNQGALFGFMGGFSPELSNLIFAVISVLAASAIVYWTTRPRTRGDAFFCLTLGLVFAGAVGNLYDRLVFGGVRDFLHFFDLPLPFGLDNWPIFNVADCFLVCGAALLIFESLLRSPEPAQQPAAPPTSSATER